nr:MAG TPA: hypothetical protein [Caudoviricetes sp.]
MVIPVIIHLFGGILATRGIIRVLRDLKAARPSTRRTLHFFGSVWAFCESQMGGTGYRTSPKLTNQCSITGNYKNVIRL